VTKIVCVPQYVSQLRQRSLHTALTSSATAGAHVANAFEHVRIDKYPTAICVHRDRVFLGWSDGSLHVFNCRKQTLLATHARATPINPAATKAETAAALAAAASSPATPPRVLSIAAAGDFVWTATDGDYGVHQRTLVQFWAPGGDPLLSLRRAFHFRAPWSFLHRMGHW
jgi:hypothetical protein